MSRLVSALGRFRVRVTNRARAWSWRLWLVLVLPVALVLGVAIQSADAPQDQPSTPATPVIPDNDVVLGASHVAAVSQEHPLVVPVTLPEGTELLSTTRTSRATLLDIYLPQQPLVTICTGTPEDCKAAVQVGQLLVQGSAQGAGAAQPYSLITNRRTDEVDESGSAALAYLTRQELLKTRLLVATAATPADQQPLWFPQDPVVGAESAPYFAGTTITQGQRVAASCGRKMIDVDHKLIACSALVATGAQPQARWQSSPYLATISTYAVNGPLPTAEPAADAPDETTRSVRWMAARPSPRGWKVQPYEFQRWQNSMGGWPCSSPQPEVDRLSVQLGTATVRLPQQSCSRVATFWGSLRLPSLSVNLESAERSNRVLVSHFIFPGPRYAPAEVPYFRPFVGANFCPADTDCVRLSGEVWD